MYRHRYPTNKLAFTVAQGGRQDKIGTFLFSSALSMQDTMTLFRLGPCLVSLRFTKFFKITRHIKSLDIYMKY